MAPSKNGQHGVHVCKYASAPWQSALTDDLELFLHILGWVTLHYVHAINSNGAWRRDRDLGMFDENYEEDRV
jgi:hypothetical protein